MSYPLPILVKLECNEEDDSKWEQAYSIEEDPLDVNQAVIDYRKL